MQNAEARKEDSQSKENEKSIVKRSHKGDCHWQQQIRERSEDKDL